MVQKNNPGPELGQSLVRGKHTAPILHFGGIFTREAAETSTEGDAGSRVSVRMGLGAEGQKDKRWGGRPSSQDVQSLGRAFGEEVPGRAGRRAAGGAQAGAPTPARR